MVCVFSLWHQPQLHFGHLMLPLRSDCAIPISCGREPGHIPIKGWGVGCCCPWNPVGWSQSAVASQKQKKQCELCQSHQNSHQCWALAKVRKANVPSRWALVPALERVLSKAFGGLYLLLCAWDLPARLVPCSAVLPELCTFKRSQVWPERFLF